MTSAGADMASFEADILHDFRRGGKPRAARRRAPSAACPGLGGAAAKGIDLAPGLSHEYWPRGVARDRVSHAVSEAVSRTVSRPVRTETRDPIEGLADHRESREP